MHLMQCAAPDHWLHMHTSDDTILLQLQPNVPTSEMQTADSGVTVTSLALQGIYIFCAAPHTVTDVSRRLLGRFTLCLAL